MSTIAVSQEVASSSTRLGKPIARYQRLFSQRGRFMFLPKVYLLALGTLSARH